MKKLRYGDIPEKYLIRIIEWAQRKGKNISELTEEDIEKALKNA